MRGIILALDFHFMLSLALKSSLLFHFHLVFYIFVFVVIFRRRPMPFSHFLDPQKRCVDVIIINDDEIVGECVCVCLSAFYFNRKICVTAFGD